VPGSNPTLSVSFKLFKIKDLAFRTIARHEQSFVSQAFSIHYGL
jgi:hypothetical protein